MQSNMQSILVAAPEGAVANQMHKILSGRYLVDTAGAPASCQSLFDSKSYELAFIDIRFLCKDLDAPSREVFTENLSNFRASHRGVPLVVMAPQNQTTAAVLMVQAGADQYLTYPLDSQEVRHLIAHMIEEQKVKQELGHLRDHLWRSRVSEASRTRSALMQETLEKIRSVAPTRTTVLLTGETGTGKSLMAKLIHSLSNRAMGPFISVHCGSIPESLVESELFGHEKGAFTGAARRKLGKFQVADKGTIFLDEVATMTPSTQIKFLEVLQEGAFSRVGGEAHIEVDVRVVAASNVDLQEMANAGAFRRDLFFRLNVFPIEVPPLRKRPEDIPLLVETFLSQHNHQEEKKISGVEPEVIQALMHYDWPGNVRELENLIERAFILERGSRLSRASFPSELFSSPMTAVPRGEGLLSLAEVRAKAVEEAERSYLHELLSVNQGRIEASAKAAGITTRQLYNLMVKHKLKKEDYRP
jgi:DNA-binding NtrC family response regulator